MKKMSGIYKYNGRNFRYDFEHAVVQYVAKATAQDRKDNEEWIKKFHKPLWEIDEKGWLLVDSIGLMRDNWMDKEARDEYLDEYCWQLDEICECEAAGLEAYL